MIAGSGMKVRSGQDKLVETLNYFDEVAKTDVYYKAQLIAAGLTKEAMLLLSDH